MKPNEYAKAIAGALLAGLSALVTALGDERVTPTEWVTVAIATIVAGGAVFGIPNAAAPRKAGPADPDTGDSERWV